MLKNRTLQSLLEDPIIADIAPHAVTNRDLSREEFYHWPLAEVAEKTGWRGLERGFARLLEAARGEYFFRLYTPEEYTDQPAKKNASLVYFPSDDAAADGRPFVLIVPGGGFVRVWNMTEGWPVAQHFNQRGYHAFVLTYQVGVEAGAVHALADMARALEIIRGRAEQFRVAPERYITCGASAGGYIVCLWNTEMGYRGHGCPKPQACFPVYPATSYRLLDAVAWPDEKAKDQFARAGLGCTMKEACDRCFEIPQHVEGFPPTAIFATEDDELASPEHSRLLARALQGAGIPCRLEIGPSGGHGFGDGTGMCMEGWPERAMNWFETI